jgi:hypothetical protein
MRRRDPALLKLLRLQIAKARRLDSQEGNAQDGSLTGSDASILQAGFDTLSVRSIRRDDAQQARKTWAVRFSTPEPKPDWLVSLRHGDQETQSVRICRFSL